MDAAIEKVYRACLRDISGIGSQRLRQLLAWFGSAQNSWAASNKDLLDLSQDIWVKNIIKERTQIDPEKIDKGLQQSGILTAMPGDENYPILLAELADAPPIIYYKGKLKSEQEALAVVGSRKATAYGRAAAEYLSKEVAAQGMAIVSGLARGIDTAAHKGAIAAGGITWAVLGCGVDQIYPPENRKLAESILEEGALISEFTPGTSPEPQHFPARNRLISGVARGVLVVEAALKSGALITVDFALEQGREVFSIPGPIFNEMSRGTNNLIRQGAKIVENANDILTEIPAWTLSGPAAAISSSKLNKPIGEEHAQILNLLSDVPLHIDQIVINCTMAASNVALGLLELQLEGEVEQLPGQYYVLARKC